MRRNGRSFIEKAFAVLLCAAMMLGVLPSGLVRAEAAPGTPEPTADDNAYGTIETITEGGESEKHVDDENGVRTSTLTFSSVDLKWSPADTNIGRTEGGWWVGAKITAPKDVTLSNVKYKRSDGSDGDFEHSYDDQDADDKYFMNVWVLVNVEFLNTAIARGADIVYRWEFDWGGEGTYEQVFEIVINTTDVTLEAGDEEKGYEGPEDGYKVTKTEESALAKVEAISEGLNVDESNKRHIVVTVNSPLELDWVAAENDIGRTKDGWWAGIKVTAPEGYDKDSTNAKFKSGADGTEKSFSGDVLDGENWAGFWSFVDPASLKEDVDHVWTFDWDGDGLYEQAIELKIDAGDKNVTLTRTEGEQQYTAYPADENSYANVDIIQSVGTVSGKVDGSGTGYVTVTVDSAALEWVKSNQGGVKRPADGWWVGLNITAPTGYSSSGSTAKYKFGAEGTESDFSGAIDDGTTATAGFWFLLNKEDENADKEIVRTVFFDWDGDGDYEQIVKLIIKTGDLKLDPYNPNEHFDQESVELIYGEQTEYETEYENKIVNEVEGAEYTYTITSGNEIANIDSATGKLTFIDGKTGTVTVSATRAGSEKYVEWTGTYTVTVKELEYTVPITPDPRPVNGSWYGSELTVNAPTGYKISKSNNLADAGWTDSVTFGKNDHDKSATVYLREDNGNGTLGGITAPITVLEKFNYDDDAPTITATADKTEWTNGDVTITGTITDTGSGVKEAHWYTDNADDTTSFAVGTDGSYSFTVNKQDYNGNVTIVATDNVGNKATQTVNVKMDVADPTMDITYDNGTIWKKIKDTLFGLKTSTITVTLTPADTASGVEKVEYSLVPEADANTTTAQTANYTVVTDDAGAYSVEISEDFRGSVYFKVTDNAGNATIYDTHADENGNNQTFKVIVDTLTPSLTASFAGGQDSVISDDGIYYSKDAVTVTLTLTANNIDLTKFPTVKLDGVEQQDIEWSTAADGKTHTASVTVAPAAGETTADVELTVEYTDYISADRDTSYSRTIHIDGDNPVITFTGAVEGEYYKTAPTVTVEVNEHNFDSAASTVTVSAKNMKGEQVNVTAAASAWNSTEDTHTATFTPAEEGVYTVTVTSTDLAGGVTTEVLTFTYDKTAPTVPEITYEDEKNLFEDIIDYLFFNSTTTVTVKTDDVTSPIDYFVVTATADGSAAATTVELPVDLKIDAATGEIVDGTAGFLTDGDINVVRNAATNTYTLTFDVPAQFRGSFEVTAADKSGNVSAADTDGTVVVVDTVAPEVSVTYAGALEDTVEPEHMQSVTTADKDTIYIYSGEITATVTVTEANFYGEDVKITVTRDGDDVTEEVTKNSSWVKVEDATKPDTYNFVMTFVDDGDYVVTVEYADKSTNDMDYTGTEYDGQAGTKTYTSNVHTIDTTDPVYTVEYDNTDIKNTVDGRDYFDAARTATITVTDRSFRPNEVSFTVTDVDSTGKDAAFTAPDLTALESWTKVEGEDYTWQATVEFDTDANYTVSFDYTDIAKNDGSLKSGEEEYSAEFTVDTVSPTAPVVEYVQDSSLLKALFEKIFFYQAATTVTVTVSDATSPIDYFVVTATADGSEAATTVELPVDAHITPDGEVTGDTVGFLNDGVSVEYDEATNTYTLTFEVPNEFRGEFAVTAADMAARTASTDDDYFVVVDTVAPEVSVTYEGALQDMVEPEHMQTVTTADEDTIYIYSGNITATVTVTEANFYGDDVKITVTRDGVDVTEEVTDGVEWVEDETDADTYNFVMTFEDDGDYVVTVEYADKSTNDMNYTGTEYSEQASTKTYTSNVHTIDTTAPVYTVEYDNNTVLNTVDGRDYFDAARTATITVTDRSFRPNEVSFTVTDVDSTGKDAAFTAPDLTALESWTKVEGEDYTWQATVEFSADANYTVGFDYTDIAKNDGSLESGETEYSAEFTVDTVSPTLLAIEEVEPSFFEKLLEGITFHFYSAPVRMRITASDATAGVFYFLYSYEVSADVSEVNAGLKDQKIEVVPELVSADGYTATAEFTVPAELLDENHQFRGKIGFEAYDRSENSASLGLTDEAGKDIEVVVDNIAPDIDVTFAPAPDGGATGVRYVGADGKDVATFDEAERAYFNGPITATITIDEANFFEGVRSGREVVHEVGILLTATDDDGVVTKTEYLPEGSAQLFADETRATVPFEWTTDGDTHTFTIELEADSDYVLTVLYDDFSANKAEIGGNDGVEGEGKYTSKVLTVDNTDPVVTVEYANSDVLNSIDGRDYFDADQLATITIVEHNFRPDDVDVNVISENVVGAEVINPDVFAQQLKDPASWTHTGNVHVATILFSTDANYTFDVDYTDLALRASADYTPDEFTVDKTAPTNLTVTYSEPRLWDTILEDLTFGFYNAQMTVTITADDDTSGVYHFMYSYLKSAGVSSVNAELIDEALREAEISFNGATATTSFNIPKLVLGSDNQFNGRVEFTAYDRSENSTDFADEERVIVVDNIAPVGEIDFGTPTAANIDGVDYYNGPIDVTIDIREANFYSRDAVVEVTRNGVRYDVSVAWTDNSVDSHTGHFTLTEDGDYNVTVNYSDRSTNAMRTLSNANQLTIDTKDPVITVTEVSNGSHNNAETVGMVLTVSDRNLPQSNIDATFTKFVKTAVSENEFNYTEEEVSLGDPVITVNEDGDTVYTYTVGNLEQDGFYSFNCTVTDYAAHTVTTMNVENAESGRQETVDEVTYTVNREGSVFWIEANYTTENGVENLRNGEINGRYLNGTVELIVHEVNVDVVDGNSDTKTAFTINNGSGTVQLELPSEDVGYISNSPISASGDHWYETTYTLRAENFAQDGVYSINIITYDEAGNVNVNTKAEAGIVNFTVDRTAPVITSNVQSGQSIRATEHTVEFRITEVNLVPESVTLKVYDRNGQLVSEQYSAGSGGEYSFTLGTGLNYSFVIEAEDMAGNKSEVYSIDRLTVSTNILILWYANTPLFWGSIGGVGVVTAGLILVLLKKRRGGAKEE